MTDTPILPILEYKDEYTDDEVEFAARQLSHLTPYEALLRHVLMTHARNTGGFSYGGEEVNGKVTGALHVYNTRNIFQQVPNPELVAEYIDGMNQADRVMEIRMLLEKIRTDWYMSMLRKRDDWPHIARYLEEQGDGFITAQGDWSMDVRANPPDETKVEVDRTPQAENAG